MLKERKVQDIGNNDESYAFIDQATKEKIKRHISDINDVISENDIKNAKIPGIESTGSLEQKSVN
jgi:hypothetical protein